MTIIEHLLEQSLHLIVGDVLDAFVHLVAEVPLAFTALGPPLEVLPLEQVHLHRFLPLHTALK